MNVDDTEQPGEPPNSYDSAAQEAGEQATPPAPETPPTPTDASETPGAAPLAAAHDIPSPAPHITPPAEVSPPGHPEQALVAPTEPPTLVYMGGSQATTPTQPPALAGSPAPLIVAALPPQPEVVAGQPPAQRQRNRGASVIAGIAMICIVAVLASGAYLIFNLFNSHAEGNVARVVPSNTVFLVSIDLVAAAARSQHVTTGDLGSAVGQGDTFKLLTGLEWNKDILPWVGRDMAFAAFQRQPPSRSPNGSQGTPASKVNDTLGGAFLLQSRDDGAAQAAMRKAAKYQEGLGFSVATLDYRGLTIYHASLIQGDESGTTLAAGKGWAIVAGDLPAARSLIDRLTGNSATSDTLADNSAYHDGLSTLPANRFGTVFLNVSALVKSFVYSAPAQVNVATALTDTYPTAMGYLAWTPDGLRAQITLPAARNVDIGSLSGDTTTLASLTPADAFAYSGVANFGATLRAETTLTSHGTTTTGTATPFLGLVPTDPALQQPAALSLISEPKGTSGFLVLLNAPDRADALAVDRQIAQQQRWTLKTTKVGGVSVTAYYAPLPAIQTAANVTTDTPTINAAIGTRLVGMDTWMDGTLIFASDATTMTDAIHTIRDHAPNIAQNTRFQRLLGEAPGGRYATTFLDLSRAATAGDDTTSVLTASLAERMQAVLITQVWNGNHYQTTVDVVLPK